MSWIRNLLSEKTRETISLKMFGLTKIPLLFYVGVSVVELTPERMVVRIPLNRRTRNHLGSMYFGALCIGADCAPGAYTMYLIRQQPVRISMVFRTSRQSSSSVPRAMCTSPATRARRSPSSWHRQRRLRKGSNDSSMWWLRCQLSVVR